ncbi:MAG: D-alanine--D-alanine ligase [Syntrophomonadaceae bacterium]|nr:D-alanine--D-alanine ligase [Syntrophomonadaceae bacterium]
MGKKRVLVMMGGSSAEREVSLRSGAAVLRALRTGGDYEAEALDFRPEALMDCLAALEQFKPDIVFITLHGLYGEDGTVQGLLELLGIPYTGSGVACNALCIDKAISKKIFKAGGFPTPPYRLLRLGSRELDEEIRSGAEDLGFPLVVKAARQGSSIGTYIVRRAEELAEAVREAFTYDNHLLLEQYIEGTELTVPVIGNDEPQVLPIIEVTAKNSFFDYEAKYTAGMCDHIIPARIPAAAAQRIEELSAQIYRYMDCRGFARIDFMMDVKGDPWLLEVNTIPGMTDMSLVPDSARAAGISFAELTDTIVKLGLDNIK